MITRNLIAAASLLALAACGSSADKGAGNSAKAGGGSSTASGPVQLQPGEWEMTMQIVNATSPNLPPAVLAQMKRAPTTARNCMTPEEAKGPKANSFAAQQNGANCKQEDFVWGNGRIHGKTSCSGVNGSGKMVMEMDGSYTPQSMDITMKSQTQSANMSVNTEMHMTGRRVGECPAGPAGKAG